MPATKTIPLIRKLLHLLTPRERRRGALILLMVTGMAALEIAGVASVMPFLSVLGNPEVVRENDALAAAYHGLGFASVDAFLIALGIAAFALILFAALFRSVTHYAMNRFIEMRRQSVGERGVRLSGGQRQRIGIARALYHDPSVLVFDEATSALDTVTEQAVMEAIEALHHQKTVILIAHRLSTVRECDQVVLLEQGQVTAAGGFEELQGQSERFRAMAAGSS